jgi:FlaA1/EpsC-like NDP-sugar epimerase
LLFDILCFMVVNGVFYILSAFGNLSNSEAVSDLGVFLKNSTIILLTVLIFRSFFKIYRMVWRYTSTRSYFNLILADALGGIAALFMMLFCGSWRGIWHCAVVVSMTCHACLMARLCYRLWYKRKNKIFSEAQDRRNAAIVGAGQLGTYLANDLRTNAHSHFDPVCFFDQDQNKINNTVVGLPVYSEKKAKEYIQKLGITDVIVAISEADSDKMQQLYNLYANMGCQVRVLDTLVQDGDGQANMGKSIREFSIEDLLFRKPVQINDRKVLDFYENTVVMVTGGGGSIGSELCRQIARCKPRHLIIVDNYENNAYEIQQELIRQYGDRLKLSVEIGSVQDAVHLEYIFNRYRPEIVFHAAAHKHVPLMENAGYEAVKNNVLGTYNAANMAEKYGTRKFVLISTDKAVNPTNVMGATKRLCEMVIQCRTDSPTSFCAVRFGNVLGSNGSVIPLFKKQIAAGGPVTVTDKNIIRYFMTIQEASQLVIRSGAMAKRGELFVLNMGKPVKIYDLAENMIRLSGLVPGKDIQIQEIGLRPGEKMYEELLIRSEVLDKTENEMIFIERDAPLSRQEMDRIVEDLRAAAAAWDEGNGQEARKMLKTVVPSFREPEELNREAESARVLQGVG